MKFLQEVRGYDLLASRRPTAGQGGFYLSQMRSQLGDPRLMVKRKLSISVNPLDVSNTPAPVKIVKTAARMPA